MWQKCKNTRDITHALSGLYSLLSNWKHRPCLVQCKAHCVTLPKWGLNREQRTKRPRLTRTLHNPSYLPLLSTSLQHLFCVTEEGRCFCGEWHQQGVKERAVTQWVLHAALSSQFCSWAEHRLRGKPRSMRNSLIKAVGLQWSDCTPAHLIRTDDTLRTREEKTYRDPKRKKPCGWTLSILHTAQ